MKQRFTNCSIRSFLPVFVLVAGFGPLHAQNSANNGLNQTNNLLSGKVIHGNLSMGQIKNTSNSGVEIADFDPSNVDPKSLLFNLNSNDMNELYKLMALYKSEKSKNQTITVLSRKNDAGQAVDTVFNFKKYVVADDLGGYTPVQPSTFPEVVVDPNSKNNINTITQNENEIEAPGQLVTSIGVADLAGLVSLYPNPAQSSITVDLSQVSGSNVRIYNIQGKLVKTVQSFMSLPQQKIDIADLPSGFYIMNVDSPNGQISKKFSKIN